MADRRSAAVKYDFLYGKSFDYSVFPATNLELSEPLSGLYAWYFALPSRQTSQDLDRYFELYGRRVLKVSAHAHFGEAFSGFVKRDEGRFAPCSLPELLATASVVFSPPLYLGISVNVQHRLREHAAALEAALQQRLPSVPSGEIEPDTPAESSSFGERVGFLLRKHGVRDLSGLFVKAVYADGTRDSLLEAEFFLNRTFTPVAGRR